MENFPANLDDGELWLPSDIFPATDQEAQHHHRRHHRRPISGGGSHMEDLSRQFSNLNLLDRHRILTPNVPSVSERLAQYALTAPPPNGCYGLTVGPTVDRGLCNYRTGPIYSNPEPALRYPMHKPVNPQAATEPLMETLIARATSRPTVQLDGRHHNRRLPLQASFGCFMTDCRRSTTAGTGVFIPRASTFTGNKSTCATTDDVGRTKLGITPHRDRARKLGVGKAEEYYCYHQVPPSDVGLPKDWTY